jgi:hypothetical protein
LDVSGDQQKAEKMTSPNQGKREQRTERSNPIAFAFTTQPRKAIGWRFAATPFDNQSADASLINHA